MSGIQIDDIFWPGDSPTPPRGRPDKYKLKVVTLDEDPYVKYSPPDPKTGTCPPNSYPCRMKSENISRSVPTAGRQQVSAHSRTDACLKAKDVNFPVRRKSMSTYVLVTAEKSEQIYEYMKSHGVHR